MAHRLDSNADNISINDMSIAQSLLDRPRIPSRHASIMGPSVTRDLDSGSNDLTESSVGNNENGRRRPTESSNTWTSSSRDTLSNQVDIEDRAPYIEEYNRVAKKHGVRLLASDDFEADNEYYSANKRSNWFSRNILRKTSSTQSMKRDRRAKHMRSISDLSLHFKLRKDTLKDKSLQELVRLCGLSRFYLPAEYAIGSLSVPTCFRATAQYLVQHASISRGVFRIPGSHNIVMELYNHYCALDEDGEAVASTVRCPTLPAHIKCDVHDVASVYKKFLSGLPGGILGSLSLFYAFVSIQNQLDGNAELTRTKQSKVRARLIALAVWTLRSHYRRELICAVFGLLSMIGRAAETARREDDRGRPLPTSDLMGYEVLGIIFGPLLLGEMMDSYEMHLANPHGSLVLLPGSASKIRKGKQKKYKSPEEGINLNNHIDRIKIANGITEMLITHWRDVVRHMRNMKSGEDLAAGSSKCPFLRPSASESFALRKPPNWDTGNMTPLLDPRISPTPMGRSNGKNKNMMGHQPSSQFSSNLVVKKHRARPRPVYSQRLSTSKSLSFLAPTIEEQSSDLIDLNSRGPSGLEEDDHSRTSLTSPTPNSVTESSTRNNSAAVAKLLCDEKSKTIFKSPEWKSLSRRNSTPALTDGAPPATSFRNAAPPVSQQQTASESKPPTVGINQASLMDLEGAISIHPRRLSVSELEYRHSMPGEPSTQAGDQMSGYFQCQHVLTTDDAAAQMPNTTQEDDQPPRANISRSLSLNEPANFSHKLMVSETHNSEENSADSAKGSARNRTSVTMELSKSSPLRIFRGLGTPKRSSEESSSTTSSKRPSKLRKSSKLESRSSRNKYTGETGTAKSNPSKTPHRTQTGPVSNSSRVSVKTLAAKFNTANSRCSFTQLSKTPTSHGLEEFVLPSEYVQESLIALYTTNSSSPTKSQRSTKSEKSIRTPLTLNESLLETPKRSSAPRRFVVQPLVNERPLHPVRNSIEEINRIENAPEDQQAENQCTKRPSPGNFSMPRGVRSSERDRDINLLRSPAVPNPFDGRSSFTTRGEEMARSSTSPSTVNQPQVANPQAPTSTVTCNPHLSESPSGGNFLSPVPGRSNSVLHGRIRTLQRQFEAKTEEIRRLRQQIDHRAYLDAGTLIEQLKAAKRDTYIWKSRAEVAEKQIELMGKLSHRSRPLTSSLQPGQSIK